MKDALDAFSALFRAIVRPVVTVMFAAVIAQAVITGISLPEWWYHLQVIPWFLALAIPLITWWFAERTVTHARERSKEP